jgi:GNAT superfamily N-acetyltransferase
MDVRIASPDDLDAVVDLAEIVDPPSTGMDVDRDYYSNIADHGRLVVAEANGIVIGYAGVIQTGSARHLSDLFVHPDAHGRGIGRQVLEAVWDAPLSDVPRQTFSSVHPSALPLYIRAGMRPMWPLLYLEGTPASLTASHFTYRDIDAEEAARKEAEWLGWNRLDQYRYWASRAGARTFVVLDGDTPVAVGCLSRSRARHTLLHLAAVDRSVMTESVSVAAKLANDSVLMAVPGMSLVVPFLVDAGWQVVEHDVYCASESGLFEAERLIPHPGLL